MIDGMSPEGPGVFNIDLLLLHKLVLRVMEHLYKGCIWLQSRKQKWKIKTQTSNSTHEADRRQKQAITPQNASPQLLESFSRHCNSNC